jgi:uncharacterized metal-binding protein
MTEERCDCESVPVLLFACAGGSNVGQMSNAAAVEIMRQGQGKLYCLAGMGAHVAGMVDSAQHAGYRIAIDGCPVACARKALEHAGVPVERSVVVTDLGITKNHELVWTYNDLDTIVQAAVQGAPITGGSTCGCACDCTGGG